MLRPRERRPPRMPNQLSPVIEGRILASAIAHPGLGPRRISATLAQERWGAIAVSANGVWRVLRRHGLSRRIKRLSLVAGYAAPPAPAKATPPASRCSRCTPAPGLALGDDRCRRLASSTLTPARAGTGSAPSRQRELRRHVPLNGWL